MLDCLPRQGPYCQLLWLSSSSTMGQVLWNVAYIVDWVLTEDYLDARLPPSTGPILPALMAFVFVCSTKAWARYSLICGFASAWWNPQFDPVTRAFNKRLKGFDVWYTRQIILIILRSLLYYIIVKGMLGGQGAPLTILAHFCSLIAVGIVRLKTLLPQIVAKFYSSTSRQIAPSSSTGRHCGRTHQRNSPIPDPAETQALRTLPEV